MLATIHCRFALFSVQPKICKLKYTKLYFFVVCRCATWSLMKGSNRTSHVELHDLYYLPNIARMIKSRSTRWMGHMEWEEKNTQFSWANLIERQHFEFLGVNGMIILRWFFKKQHGKV